jgi:hypothetical protein
MEDQNAPATRQDLGAATQRLDEKIEQLRSEMNHGYRDLVERINDSETHVLQAFYSFAESNEKRMLQTEANVVVFLSRMATFESRLLAVEKRLNMPPAA